MYAFVSKFDEDEYHLYVEFSLLNLCDASVQICPSS